MALPSILRVRKRATEAGSLSSGGLRSKEAPNVSKADIRRSTKPRRVFVMIASTCYLLSFIFLVLVSFYIEESTDLISSEI